MYYFNYYLINRTRFPITQFAFPFPALLSAVCLLNTVVSVYQSAEAYLKVKDTLYLQVRLYHELGSVPERNKCAYQFRQLESQYPFLSKDSVNAL